MDDTGQVPFRILSSADLMAVAEALEHEAAARYRSLAARMAQQGDQDMAAQFDALARMEDRHASQIGDRSVARFGRRPDLAQVRWEAPPGYDDGEARGSELSVYQALAFAVRNEERAFAFYCYMSAEAESDDIRALADDLARDELHHAALLRQYRRRAFHQNRPEAFAIPRTLEELRALAQGWDAEAMSAHAALAETLHAGGGHSDAAIFRRLADEEALCADGAEVAAVRTLRNVADGLRLIEEGFERFASIAERADDEALIAEAQMLASRMIARLAMAGGARGNSLLGPATNNAPDASGIG